MTSCPECEGYLLLRPSGFLACSMCGKLVVAAPKGAMPTSPDDDWPPAMSKVELEGEVSPLVDTVPASVEESMPDYAEALIGWRAWRIDGPTGLMMSATGECLWSPREAMEATCRYNKPVQGQRYHDGVPGFDCTCVPLDTEILTQRGWLAYDQVRVGDRTLGINPLTKRSEWTTIRRVIHRDPEPIYRVGNGYWSARATADHRWPVWRGAEQRYLTTLELPGHNDRARTKTIRATDEVVTKAPYVGGGGALTPTEAAIIAWLHTDGSISNQRILQSKPAGIAAIRRLLVDVPHTVGVRPAVPISGCAVGGDSHVFRIRTPYFEALWKKAGLCDGKTLAQVVLSLGRPALEAFMEAAWLAEGSMNGKARVLTQNRGPTFDALNLGVYLLGYRPRVHSHDSESSLSPRRGVCARITYAESKVGRPQLTVEKQASEPTWCVTTDLGTWTMRQDEHILPTGNCGLYSAKTREHLVSMGYQRYQDDSFHVMGEVWLWGHVVEGSQGWRAQFGYCKHLYLPFEAWHLAKGLREAYGVPVTLSNLFSRGAE